MKSYRNLGLWAFAAIAAVMIGADQAHAGNLLEKIIGIEAGAFGIVIQMTIILTSMFMLGWSIECFVNVTRDKIIAPEVVAALQGYVEEGDLEGALQYCEAAPNPITRIVAAPLSRMHSGWDSMKDAVEQQIVVEEGKLISHISPLSLVAALGPMMGLFGTVSGMVGAFDKMAVAGDSMSPMLVAGSIGLALMSTVMGLLVAIPGMVSFWFFSNRVTRITDEINMVTDEIMDTLRGYVEA